MNFQKNFQRGEGDGVGSFPSQKIMLPIFAIVKRKLSQSFKYSQCAHIVQGTPPSIADPSITGMGSLHTFVNQQKKDKVLYTSRKTVPGLHLFHWF